jgi:hypothetical protein
MATTSIVVNANPARSITVDPTRVFFRGGLAEQQLRWLPAGQASITGIDFPAGAPIDNLFGPGPGGIWTADWQPAQSDSEAQTWKYSIDVSIDSEPLTRLDPEIENGVPPVEGNGG